MILERKDGTKIELTCDEVSKVHRYFVTEWMKSTAKEILNGYDDGIYVTEEDFADIAEAAFDIYAKGDGLTEYEAVENAVDEFVKERIKEVEEQGKDDYIPNPEDDHVIPECVLKDFVAGKLVLKLYNKEQYNAVIRCLKHYEDVDTESVGNYLRRFPYYCIIENEDGDLLLNAYDDMTILMEHNKNISENVYIEFNSFNPKKYADIFR